MPKSDTLSIMRINHFMSFTENFLWRYGAVTMKIRNQLDTGRGTFLGYSADSNANAKMWLNHY